MRKEPFTLANLRELRRNADLGKFRHFAAARRSKNLNNWLGVPAVIINIVLGSVFFVAVSAEIPNIFKWVSAFLALAGALLGGIQTFFRFSKAYEGHHRVANQYTAVVRESENLECLFLDDLIAVKDFADKANELHRQYQEITRQAEDLLTSDGDYLLAVKKQGKRQRGLAARGLTGPKAESEGEKPTAASFLGEESERTEKSKNPLCRRTES